MVIGIVKHKLVITYLICKLLVSNNLSIWRMGRDSNPRYLAVHTLSRRAQSTALAPIRNEPAILKPQRPGFNLFLGRFKHLRQCIQFGLELALTFLDHFESQLISMQLDGRVMNVPFDFVHLGLDLPEH